ncbi:hypothetical protein ACA910_006082 [Epithemia clementina (nom. ined.)]
MISNLISGWMWMTFAPFTAAVSSLWNVPTNAVNALAGVYMYLFVGVSILASFALMVVKPLQRQQSPIRGGSLLYPCFVIGAILNVLGATLRYTGARAYTTVYLGTVLAAMAHCALAATSPLLIASVWSESSNGYGISAILTTRNHEPQSTTKTTAFTTATHTGNLLCTVASQLGTAMGFGVSMVLTTGSSARLDMDTLQRYLGFQLALSCVALLIALLLVRQNSEFMPHDHSKPLRFSSSQRPPLCPKNKKHHHKKGPSSFAHRKTHSPTDVMCFDETVLILLTTEEKNRMDDWDTEIQSFGDESSLLLGDASLILGYGGDTVASLEGPELEGGSSPCGPSVSKEPSLQPPKSAMQRTSSSGDASGRKPPVPSSSASSSWQNYVIHVLLFGLPMGVLYAIPIFLSQFLRLPGIKDESSAMLWVSSIAWLGIAFQLSGLGGLCVAFRLIGTAEIQEPPPMTGRRNSWTLQSLFLAGATLCLMVLLAASTSAASPPTNNNNNNKTYGPSSNNNMNGSPEEESFALTSFVIVVGLIGSGFFLAAASAIGVEVCDRQYPTLPASPSGSSSNSIMSEGSTDAAKTVVDGMVRECPARLVGLFLVTACGWIQNTTPHQGGQSVSSLSYEAGGGGDLYVLLLMGYDGSGLHSLEHLCTLRPKTLIKS